MKKRGRALRRRYGRTAIPSNVSKELADGIRAYDRHIESIGGYGTRISARTLGTAGVERTGILIEGGLGGVQPAIQDDDGRKWRIHLDSARRIK